MRTMARPNESQSPSQRPSLQKVGTGRARSRCRLKTRVWHAFRHWRRYIATQTRAQLLRAQPMPTMRRIRLPRLQRSRQFPDVAARSVARASGTIPRTSAPSAWTTSTRAKLCAFCPAATYSTRTSATSGCSSGESWYVNRPSCVSVTGRLGTLSSRQRGLIIAHIPTPVGGRVWITLLCRVSTTARANTTVPNMPRRRHDPHLGSLGIYDHHARRGPYRNGRARPRTWCRVWRNGRHWRRGGGWIGVMASSRWRTSELAVGLVPCGSCAPRWAW